MPNMSLLTSAETPLEAALQPKIQLKKFLAERRYWGAICCTLCKFFFVVFIFERNRQNICTCVDEKPQL